MSNLKIKKEFIADFIRAENTFLYQIVYDPRLRRQRPLNDYPASDGTAEDEDVCFLKWFCAIFKFCNYRAYLACDMPLYAYNFGTFAFFTIGTNEARSTKFVRCSLQYRSVFVSF